MKSLTPTQQKFILHWGKMGTKWGINRTVAQIHALLFISQKPLAADEIVDLLALARSNVSTGLRELQNWGIVKVVHVMGDRRDHFETMQDVWEIFRVIMAERKRREIDPTLSILQECLNEARTSKKEDVYTSDRLSQMRDFIQTMTGWYEQMNTLSTPSLMKAVKLGNKLFKVLGVKPC